MKYNRKVWTPNGYQVGPTNSMVGKGESIINYSEGTSTLVTKGQKGKDNQPSSVTPDDDNVIAGNDKDYIGYYRGKTGGKLISFADQVAPLTAIEERLNKASQTSKNPHLSSLSRQTQEVQEREINKLKEPLMAQMREITDRQAQQHELEDQYNNFIGSSEEYAVPGYKKGKSFGDWFNGLFRRGYDRNRTAGNESTDVINETKTKRTRNKSEKTNIETKVVDTPTWQRLAPTIAGLGTSLLQLNHWARSPLKYHNTYSGNPYASRALQELASLRHNPYPELRAAQDAERRAAYANATAGGLTASQRYLGRLGLGLGTANATAGGLTANAEQQNNAYRQNYAQAALAEGVSAAQRRQQANQYDWQDYVAAHGRKTKGIETAAANILNSLYMGYKNTNDFNIWRDTRNLYEQQLDNQRKDLVARSEAAAADRDANMVARGYSLDSNGRWTRSTNTEQPASTPLESISYRSFAPNWRGGYTRNAYAPYHNTYLLAQREGIDSNRYNIINNPTGFSPAQNTYQYGVRLGNFGGYEYNPDITSSDALMYKYNRFRR